MPYDIPELIEQIYRASTEPDLWPDICRMLSDELKANTALLPHDLDNIRLIGTPISHGYDPYYVDICGHFHGDRNPFISRDWPQPEGSVVPIERIVERKSLENTEYYNDWMRPQRLSHLIGSNFQVGSGTQLYIALARDKAFKDSEAHLLDQLIPHLRQSLRIGAHLDNLFSPKENFGNSLDHIRVAAVSVARDGTVLDTNAEADHFLKSNNILNVRFGKIHLAGSGSLNALQDALRKVVDGGAAQNLIYAGQDGSVRITLQPIATSHIWLGDVLPRALLLIHTPRKDKSKFIELARSNNLTPAEERLFGFLAQGRTLAEYSESHDVSRNTAKSQLQAVFRKMGVSRQADLVRLAANG
ncbi:LuxR C-terminal-related transcriptional regulator [Microvirga sp. 2YAF29]|uniref:helix-turn-helix transcriptional regulator n=1 Tax=Microvirga sp. 2YAF29 TaxID=3233031 RepID=UPI003F9A6B90